MNLGILIDNERTEVAVVNPFDGTTNGLVYVGNVRHVAVFKKASWAKEFIAKITGPGWGCKDVTYETGGIVRFTARLSDDEDRWAHWQGWALTVGGSAAPLHPPLLDGHRCPVEW